MKTLFDTLSTANEDDKVVISCLINSNNFEVVHTGKYEYISFIKIGDDPNLVLADHYGTMHLEKPLSMEWVIDDDANDLLVERYVLEYDNMTVTFVLVSELPKDYF